MNSDERVIVINVGCGKEGVFFLSVVYELLDDFL